MSGLPLAGTRVLSLAEQYPGPFATVILADLGADVILIERPEGGDPARQFPAFFEALNRNKRSVALDLKTTEGFEACLRLIDGADVWLEGFRPGVMARLGLGYLDVAARRPEIVYVSISGFGQQGPYRHHPAHDLSYQGFSGVLSHLRDAAGVEDIPIQLGDLTAGLYAVIAAMSGLMQRALTGVGVHVDLSVVDSLVSLMSAYIVPIVNDSGAAGFPIEPGYGVFETSDGAPITLSVVHEDKFWVKLCWLLDMEEHKHLSHVERLERGPQLRSLIRAKIMTRPSVEWLHDLQSADIPSGPIYAPKQIYDDPHFTKRGLFVEGPDGTLFTRQPFLLDGKASEVTRPSPGLGEHTEEILAEAGLDLATIDAVLRLRQ